jgi:phage shock protein C
MAAKKSNVKKLLRSKNNRKLAGVCGGIAEYLGADPTIVRLIWVVITLLTGIVPGIIAYLIAWLVIPEE